jgi:thioredoxin reductase
MAIDTPARIAVLGAGPVGLEAALYARYLGYEVDLYELGRLAENVLRWGHLRMFSPFGANRSLLGLAALRAQDPNWQAPSDDALLRGREYVERYLLPLARSDLLADRVHEQTEVVAIGRDGPLKTEPAGDETRAQSDFRLLLRSTSAELHAQERIALADAVIDASGTFGHHNWLGQGGMPAIGETDAEPHIEYGLPDVLEADRSAYAGRNVLLVGDGDSAATNLVALAELAAQAPDTWITWVTRGHASDEQSPPVRVIADDPLPQREQLARQANRLAADDANHVSHLGGTVVEAVFWHADLDRFSVQLVGKHAVEMEFDRVIANVGYRPDARMYGELQIDHCPVTDAPRTVTADATAPTASLILREPDFYVLGAKSRGRDSRFLISDGFEQIRALFAILGDRAELDLYSTMTALAGPAKLSG